MEKDIEEIKAAVLAECERLCPSTRQNHIIIPGKYPVRLYRSNRRYGPDGRREDIGITRDGDVWVEGFEINCFGMPIILNERESDQNFVLAYRLLGLETRDAVAQLQNTIENLEKRKNELLDECVHRMRTDSVGTSLYDLIILAHENGVPMITKSNMYLNGSPKQIPVYTWASTTHENPISHIIDLLAQRDFERAKAAMLLEELQEISEMYDPYSNRSDSQMAQKAKYAVEAYKN